MHDVVIRNGLVRDALTLSIPERLAALSVPERRRRIIEDIPNDGGFFQGAVLPSGRPPMELVLDQLTAHDGNGLRYHPFFNYAYVAGVRTVDHDEFTGELPGRAVRGPQPDSTTR